MQNKVEIKLAGVIFFVAIAQFILAMLLAEVRYPGYSVSGNYISDLGVGSTAFIFNTSIIILGILLIAGAFLTRNVSRAFAIIMILAGIGAMGVGIFPETTGSPHVYSSLIVFSMGSIAPIPLLIKIRNALSISWVILGALGFVSLVLFATHQYLGLGHGGMERFIVYPDLLWGMAFGGWLVGNTETK